MSSASDFLWRRLQSIQRFDKCWNLRAAWQWACGCKDLAGGGHVACWEAAGQHACLRPMLPSNKHKCCYRGRLHRRLRKPRQGCMSVSGPASAGGLLHPRRRSRRPAHQRRRCCPIDSHRVDELAADCKGTYLPGLRPQAACGPGEAPQRSLQHFAGHPILTPSSPGGLWGRARPKASRLGRRASPSGVYHACAASEKRAGDADGRASRARRGKQPPAVRRQG